MSQQHLHGFERVRLCEKPAGKRSAARVAAVAGAKARRAVQARDVALQTIGRQVFDQFAGTIGSALDTLFVPAALVREDPGPFEA